MKRLDLKAAFLHVIDGHRWLAAGGCAWNLVGANAANGTKEEAHQLLPNIDVMILDSLLQRARSLIDFYSKTHSGTTDIFLSDFSISLDEELREKLAEYKKPIEVHLLHLTDWRSREYRDLYAIGNDADKDRPDWNHHATLVVELVLDALKKASDQSGVWQQPFRDLHEASTARYRNKKHDWPANLGEKNDVEQYLLHLGR